MAELAAGDAGAGGSGDGTLLPAKSATPVKLMLLTGATQLPDRAVGAGTRDTLDPRSAPPVTRALIVGTMPPSVALQVIVDVSPLFQVTGNVPLALPTRPPAPTAMQPRVAVPEMGPPSPV